MQRALISVSDKTGIVDLARELAAAGIELVSTGGTAAELRGAGLDVRDVADLTGQPEVMGGRVKTLHPRVHGALLARRDVPRDLADLAAMGGAPIDLVVVNLYPFRETIARPGTTTQEAIEQIDIGGPSMLRAAAKNHAHVTVVVDPADYPSIAAAVRDAGEVDAADRTRLAAKAFRHVAAYDSVVAQYLTELADDPFPEQLTITLDKVQDLRYGENPHQGAAFYADGVAAAGGLPGARQLQGKELSYNNIADADAALAIAAEFSEPAVAIVKHVNPCGVAVGGTSLEAWHRALAADPVSAFGGIVAVTRTVDAEFAAAMSELFLEVVLAPSFEPAALEVFAAKPNLRVLEVATADPASIEGSPLVAPARASRRASTVAGGMLLQHTNVHRLDRAAIDVVTKVAPSEQQLDDLLFGWRVVKHVTSNAVVLAGGGSTLGIGAGQMNRVGAARIAIDAAGDRARGSALASDAFFPMPNSIELAADAGIAAIIQPGGSRRDADVIAACDDAGIAMVFTGVRHFLALKGSSDMHVLVIGGGGREHAIVAGLDRAVSVDRISCAPGLPGIAEHAECIPTSSSCEDLERIAIELAPDLVVVGPEAPLVAGLADRLRARGFDVLGPGADGALLEGSKWFSKQVLDAASVATARAWTFNDASEAEAFVRERGEPMVVKADGLAAGKGVVVAASIDETIAAIRAQMVDRCFGDAGRRVVLEQRLAGPELSVLALVSGREFRVLAPARDHKRAYVGDTGPNTGGMGAVCPAPGVDQPLLARIERDVLRPVVDELADRGIDYRGVLYAGLMLTDDGPHVIEFNVRFGDPEAQAVLPRLASDLGELLAATARGTLADSPALEWDPRTAVTVVVATEGYPDAPRTGGLVELPRLEDVEAYHAGTVRDEAGVLRTAGGRVLAVTALHEDLARARERANEAAAAVRFEGAWHRTDIGAATHGKVTHA